MSNEVIAKFLIITGAALALIGVVFYFLSKSGITRLPGDIRIERDGFIFSFPIVTCIVVSIVLTILVNFFWRR